MPNTLDSADAIALRGQSIYNEQIKPLVEPTHKGKFVAIDIDTGEYEIDPRDATACQRLRHRLPSANLFAVKAGHPAAYRLTARIKISAPDTSMLQTPKQHTDDASLGWRRCFH